MKGKTVNTKEMHVYNALILMAEAIEDGRISGVKDDVEFILKDINKQILESFDSEEHEKIVRAAAKASGDKQQEIREKFIKSFIDAFPGGMKDMSDTEQERINNILDEKLNKPSEPQN